MKLEVLQENLNQGLSAVVRVIASRSQVPILGNVLLQARKEGLVLMGSNAETSVVVEVGAKVIEEGEFTVPARTFSEIIGSLMAEKIVLELVEGSLTIKSGTFGGKINGIAAGEYPRVVSEEGGKTIEVAAGELEKATSRAVIATAADEGRAVLTGVLFRMEGEKLTLAATDGFRLSVVYLKGVSDGGKESGDQFIVPARTLTEVSRTIGEWGRHGSELKNKAGKVKMIFSDDNTQVWFDFGTIKIYSRLIAGTFPDFEKIIPANFAIKIGIKSEEFNKAIRLAAVFARDSANIVKLKIKGDKLKITANAAQVGENESEIEVEGEKESEEELIVAFNYRYLMDLLSVVDSKEVTAELNGALAPGVFRVTGEENFLHIIMPVRVQS